MTKLRNAKCNLFVIQRADLSKEVLESHLELIRTLCVYQEGNRKASKKAFLEYFLDEWNNDYAKLNQYTTHFTAKKHKQRANVIIAMLKKAAQDLKEALIWELQGNQLFNSFRGVMKAFFDCTNAYTDCFQKLLAIKHSPNIEKDLEYFQATFTYHAKKMLFWIEAFEIKARC